MAGRQDLILEKTAPPGCSPAVLNAVHSPSPSKRSPMYPTNLYADSPKAPIGLRPRDAAAALGISLSTLARLTRAGEIPVAKVGRCTCYPVAPLKAWLAARSHGGSHDAR